MAMNKVYDFVEVVKDFIHKIQGYIDVAEDFGNQVLGKIKDVLDVMYDYKAKATR